MNDTNSEYQKLTYEAFYLNLNRGKWWGAGLMGYWAALVLVCSLENFGSRFYPHATLAVKKRIGRCGPVRLFRHHISMPALFNGKHTMANTAGGVMPTRLEAAVLFCYFVLIVIGESVNYEVMQHNVYFPDKRDQISRYIGDRSAIISMFILIPTFLFAGRNNLLLWLTGWKQSRFYAFHKWLARMAIASALVHTLSMLLNVYWCHTIHTRKYTQYWRWGAVAIVAAVLMLFQSISLIRSHWYEFFLYGHIVLAVFFLIGVWIHLQEVGFGQYAYAIAAIWAFDVFARIVRIASFGICPSHVTIIGDDILLLTIPDLAAIKGPTPGSFGYVYFLTGWVFFQSHPFSIMQREDGTVAFSIKVKNGVTRRIYNDLLNSPNGSRVIKVALEGFYGEYKPVYAYDQVIMVSSGSGVLGPLEYIRDIERMKTTGRSRTAFVKIYCIVRHWRGIEWLVPELLRLQELEYVQPVIYITQPETGKFDQEPLGAAVSQSSSCSGRTEVKIEMEFSDEAAGKEPDTKEAPWAGTPHEHVTKKLPHVEFRFLRPDVLKLLADDLEGAAASAADSVAVMTCAYGALCDEVRSMMAIEVSKAGSCRADLVELLQAW